MSLRLKILFTMFSIVLLVVAGLFVSAQTILLGSYAELERESMELDLDRVGLALEEELNKMGVISRDWGVWDDTYRFINDANQEYIDANLNDDTLVYLNLDFMIYLRNSGEIVYAKAVDLETGEAEEVPPGISDVLSPGSYLLEHSNKDHLYYEIISVDSGTYLVLSGPILPTDGAGDIGGSLVLGREVSDNLIASIANTIRLPFEIWDYHDTALPADVAEAAGELTGEEKLVAPEDRETVVGYSLIHDYQGRPALVVKLELPRDIYLQGQSTVNFFLVAAILASAGLGVLIYLLMGRLVIRRLNTLSAQVQAAGQGGEFPTVIQERDEIGLLAGEMAATFKKLRLTNDELAESEERYRVLVSLGTESGEAIVMLRDADDMEGKQVFVSDSWSRLTGYDTAELSAMSFFDLVATEDRDESLDRHRRKIEGKQLAGFYEMRIRRKDGTMVPIELTSSIAAYRGRPVNVLYIRDVSERKKMEEALRAEEEQKKRLLNDTVEIIQSVAADGRYIFVNSAWHRLLGYSEADLGHLKLFDVIHPDSLEHCRELFARVMAGHPASGISVTFKTKDGREVRVEGNVVPRTEDGKVIATHGFFRDVTERERLETARRESERMYATLVSNLPGFVYRCANDHHWTMKLISDGCYPVTGYRPEDFIDNARLAFGNIIEESYREPIYQAWQEVLSRRGTFEEEYPITDAAGATHWVWERGQGVFGENGELLFLEGFITDITERKLAETKERQLRDKAEMSSRLAAVGEMAAGIAHEINNPLTGVIGFAELLMGQEGVPDEIRDEIQIIHDGSQRVKEIIRRMLVFAQQSRPSSHLSNIHELLDNTLELRSYVLRTANIEVIRQYDDSLPAMMLDPGQMQQVFLNLIVNAEYAMKKVHGRGRLTVGTERVDERVRVTIEDDGGGIPTDARSRLFQPFFTTKEPGEGTGLGLSLSRGIVAEHGGTIDENGLPGVGARFLIDLPIITATGQAEDNEDSQTSAPVADSNGYRILAVDDEPAVRAYIKARLDSVGHRTEVTGDHQAAMQLLSEKEYDLVLLDIRMPGRSGLELYSEIIAHWPQLNRRVIFVTGDVSDQTVRDYLEQHHLPWVTKPFDLATLTEKIRTVMEDTGG
jgi:PAS domain S-box-containing protein